MAFCFLPGSDIKAQSCPVNQTTDVNAYPNTYFPANQTTVNAGAKSIVLGAATYGSTPISSGDVLLIIQMQGAQINSTNTSAYGGNNGTGSGYLSTNLLAGNMEYMVAANSVAIGGGTLNIQTGLSHAYKNTAFGTDGQYSYQVLRVPQYYNLRLTGTITAPRWNGATGGVIVLNATNNINMNSQTIDVSGLGFRGGGGQSFNGSGSGSSSDYITLASSNANGGKGEGIAGTPKYLNNNNSFLDVSTYEGYPNGSYGRGAPGNAGGGGTDGNPVNNNNENTGGGGGGNGGLGGGGGNAWSSGTASGGVSGPIFAEATPSRLVMGGGGGSGTTNNATGSPGNGFASSGAAGGGIVMIIANTVTGSGTIKAFGSAGNSTVKNDGSGGGGAGGSVLIFAKNGGTSNLVVNARGGSGGSNQTTTVDPHGPGGGGGGGVIFTNVAVASSSSVAGGAAGTTNKYTSNYGATAGSVGVLVQNATQTQMPTFPVACVVLPLKIVDIAAGVGGSAAGAGAAGGAGLGAGVGSGLGSGLGAAVTVRWTVSEEVDAKEYIIERSEDGINYVAAGTVAAGVAATGANGVTGIGGAAGANGAAGGNGAGGMNGAAGSNGTAGANGAGGMTGMNGGATGGTNGAGGAGGMTGTEGGLSAYSFVDHFSLASVVYYRVKGVASEDYYVYSKVVSVSAAAVGGGARVSVYPNPVRSSATVAFTVSAAGSVSLRLVDMSGAVVRQIDVAAMMGRNEVRLDGLSVLPKGMYILQWYDGVRSEQTKVLINQ